MRTLLVAIGGALRGALVGTLFGASARLLMRVVALGSEEEPSFDLATTLALVGLFALSGAGCGLVAATSWSSGARVATALLSSALLFLLGLAFTIGEVAEVLAAGSSPATTAWQLVLAALVLLLVVATPFTASRAGAWTLRGSRG